MGHGFCNARVLVDNALILNVHAFQGASKDVVLAHTSLRQLRGFQHMTSKEGSLRDGILVSHFRNIRDECEQIAMIAVIHAYISRHSVRNLVGLHDIDSRSLGQELILCPCNELHGSATRQCIALAPEEDDVVVPVPLTVDEICRIPKINFHSFDAPDSWSVECECKNCRSGVLRDDGIPPQHGAHKNVQTRNRNNEFRGRFCNLRCRITGADKKEAFVGQDVPLEIGALFLAGLQGHLLGRGVAEDTEVASDTCLGRKNEHVVDVEPLQYGVQHGQHRHQWNVVAVAVECNGIVGAVVCNRLDGRQNALNLVRRETNARPQCHCGIRQCQPLATRTLQRKVLVRQTGLGGLAHVGHDKFCTRPFPILARHCKIACDAILFQEVLCHVAVVHNVLARIKEGQELVDCTGLAELLNRRSSLRNETCLLQQRVRKQHLLANQTLRSSANAMAFATTKRDSVSTMKRLNPETGLPFKRGDIRTKNGKQQRFWCYVSKQQKTGCFVEQWVSEDAYNKKTDYLKIRYGKFRTPVSVAKSMMHSSRKRAEEKGLPFDLSHEYIMSLDVSRCSVTGVALRIACEDGKQNFLSPSLDRIEPRLGYIEGNVRVVANAINSCKGSAAEDDPAYVDLIVRYANRLLDDRHDTHDTRDTDHDTDHDTRDTDQDSVATEPIDTAFDTGCETASEYMECE
jgi:hypothetical protein